MSTHYFNLVFNSFVSKKIYNTTLKDFPNWFLIAVEDLHEVLFWSFRSLPICSHPFLNISIAYLRNFPSHISEPSSWPAYPLKKPPLNLSCSGQQENCWTFLIPGSKLLLAIFSSCNVKYLVQLSRSHRKQQYFVFPSCLHRNVYIDFRHP